MRSLKWALCFIAVCISSTAYSQSTKSTLEAFKSPNPLSRFMDELQGCTLVRPLYPQFDLSDKVNEASVGNMTVPVKVANATVIDVGGAEDSNASICKVTDFKPAKLVEPKKWPFQFGVGFRDDFTASLKLTMGTWLKLVDFDAKDLTTIKIGIEGGNITYDDSDLGNAARDIKKYKEKACIAWKAKQAKMISRNCIGYVYVGLESTKGVTLNALDLTFAKMTVGLKAEWIREIKGTLQNCEVGEKPAAADGAGKKSGEQPAAAENKDGKSGESEKKVEVKTKDGPVTISSKGVNVSLTLPSSIVDQTKKPSTAPAQKEKSTEVAPTDKKADGESKANPPASKSCITAVLYRTNVPVIYGVRLRDAAIFKKWASQ